MLLQRFESATEVTKGELLLVKQIVSGLYLSVQVSQTQPLQKLLMKRKRSIRILKDGVDVAVGL